MSESDDKELLIDLTADIVAAYIKANSLVSGDLPGLIGNVHAAIMHAASNERTPANPSLSQAVPIKKSVTPDYIFCLEDGKKFKSLKRHLSTRYDLTPDAYRAKWGLPRDYPMVAPNYGAVRSQLAKKGSSGSRVGGLMG